MIVWIEPEHGKKFGIHYPLPMGRSSVAEGGGSSGYRTEMEILGPEKDAITQSSILTSESDYGIAAAFRDSSGLAVLELKIPRKAKARRIVKRRRQVAVCRGTKGRTAAVTLAVEEEIPEDTAAKEELHPSQFLSVFVSILRSST